MSALSEYLKLIPKGLPNSAAIIEGIINNVEMKYNVLPAEQKEEIVRRRLLCLTCPFNSEKAATSEEYFEMTGRHYSTKREKLHCSICGCPIDIRTASMEASCGIEEWNSIYPEKQIQVRWESFKK